MSSNRGYHAKDLLNNNCYEGNTHKYFSIYSAKYFENNTNIYYNFSITIALPSEMIHLCSLVIWCQLLWSLTEECFEFDWQLSNPCCPQRDYRYWLGYGSDLVASNIKDHQHQMSLNTFFIYIYIIINIITVVIIIIIIIIKYYKQFRIMASCRTGVQLLSKPVTKKLMAPFSITRQQWVNCIHNHVISYQKIESTDCSLKSLAWYKTAVTPLLMHKSYSKPSILFFSLFHQCPVNPSFLHTFLGESSLRGVPQQNSGATLVDQAHTFNEPFFSLAHCRECRQSVQCCTVVSDQTRVATLKDLICTITYNNQSV